MATLQPGACGQLSEVKLSYVLLLSFHFILYRHDQAKMPLLHWPDFLLGLSECPHFLHVLRTCSTVLLWTVKGLISSNTSGQARAVSIACYFWWILRRLFHLDIHDFIQRNVGSVCLYHVICKIAVPKVDKTATLIRQCTQFHFCSHYPANCENEESLIAACVKERGI